MLCLFCREQRQQFKALVEQKFHEWLLETGHRQELDSLTPFTVSPEDPTGDQSSAQRLLEPKARDTKQKGTNSRQAMGRTPMAC